MSTISLSIHDDAEQAPLIRLYDDNLISILGYLTPQDIIAVRKTCKRLFDITNTRIVWTHARMRYISLGYPFPKNGSLDAMPRLDLEKLSFTAYRLGQKWLLASLNPEFAPRIIHELPDISSAAIVDVQFVPGHGDKWVITISKSVWSVLALWDITSALPLKSSTSTTWSPKGGIFKSFCLNTDPNSVATLAIGLLHDGTEMLYILSITEASGKAAFEKVASFPTDFSPVALDGDLIALSDQQSQVVIWNWKTNEYATLIIGQDDDDSDRWRQNSCNQVLFSRSSNTILVVRDQSIHLFPFPEPRSTGQEPLTYTEIASHNFDWIAGICVTITNSPRNLNAHNIHSFSILLRRKGSNPWSSDTHSIEHYTILPDPTYDPEHSTSVPDSTLRNSPYIFPPVLQSQISDLRGSLSNIVRSTNIALGRNGTAVWINPRDRAAAGLLGSDDEYAARTISRTSQGDERLMAAVFQGPLLGQTGVVFKGTIVSNDANNWTAMDYDEDRGRIAIGSSCGDLLIIIL